MQMFRDPEFFHRGYHHHCGLTKYGPVNHQSAGLENSHPSLTVFARKDLKIFQPAICQFAGGLRNTVDGSEIRRSPVDWW